MALVTGSVGVVALASGLEGYFFRPATWLERGCFVVAAVLLIHPNLTTDAVGLGFLVAALGLQKLYRPAARPTVASTREPSRT